MWNMQTRKTTSLQMTEAFLSEVHVVTMNVKIKQWKESVLKTECPFGYHLSERKKSVVGSDERLQLSDTQQYLEAVIQGEKWGNGYHGRKRIRRRSWWSSSWWVTNARRSAAGVCSGAWSRVLAGASWTPMPPGQGTRRLSALCGSLWIFPPVSARK